MPTPETNGKAAATDADQDHAQLAEILKRNRAITRLRDDHTVKQFAAKAAKALLDEAQDGLNDYLKGLDEEYPLFASLEGDRGQGMGDRERNGSGLSSPNPQPPAPKPLKTDVIKDTLAALLSVGYTEAQARHAIDALPKAIRTRCDCVADMIDAIYKMKNHDLDALITEVKAPAAAAADFCAACGPATEDAGPCDEHQALARALATVVPAGGFEDLFRRGATDEQILGALQDWPTFRYTPPANTPYQPWATRGGDDPRFWYGHDCTRWPQGGAGYAELAKLIRKQLKIRKPRAGKKTEPAAAEATPPAPVPAPAADQDNPEGDGWEGRPVTALAAHGLPETALAKLVKVGFFDLGDLAATVDAGDLAEDAPALTDEEVDQVVAALRGARGGAGKNRGNATAGTAPAAAIDPNETGTLVGEFGVTIGDVVRTNYGTGPYRVVKISPHKGADGKTLFDLTCKKADNPKDRGTYYLNDLRRHDNVLITVPRPHDQVFLCRAETAAADREPNPKKPRGKGKGKGTKATPPQPDTPALFLVLKYGRTPDHAVRAPSRLAVSYHTNTLGYPCTVRLDDGTTAKLALKVIDVDKKGAAIAGQAVTS